MGSTKISGDSNQVSSATPTAEEKEMQALQLKQFKTTEPYQTQAQMSGLSLVNQLLLGQQPTGDLYQQMSGISPEAIGQQATQYAQRAMPGMQGAGLMNSGVMQREISRGIANEVLMPAEQFNIGAKQNLLNLALSGQAQVQAPVSQGTSQLAQQLAGLRTIVGSGSTQKKNPFTGINLGTGTFGMA